MLKNRIIHPRRVFGYNVESIWFQYIGLNLHKIVNCGVQFPNLSKNCNNIYHFVYMCMSYSQHVDAMSPFGTPLH